MEGVEGAGGKLNDGKTPDSEEEKKSKEQLLKE